MKIIIALLVLSVIIIIHELGHFLLAKANGVGVTEFSVGMGPKLVKVKRGETLYCIKILPFGGSCMMVGEDEDSNDERAFNNKSVWARISVIAAGPIFNFVLAFVMAVIVVANVGYDPCVISKVAEDSVAYEAGLREGDKIVSINGKKVHFGREYSLYELISPDKTMNIVYERDGQLQEATITPQFVQREVYQVGISINNLVVVETAPGKPAANAGLMKDDIIKQINGIEMETVEQAIDLINNSNGNELVITVLRGEESLEFKVTPAVAHMEGYVTGITINYNRVKTTALDTVIISFHEVGYWIDTVFESLGMMIRGDVSKDDVAGPVGVVNMIGNVVEESKDDGVFYVFLNLFNMIMMLSANLGVMNLLPIPALDGGRLVFLIIEAIRRKPIDREKEGMVHFVGIILLLILMVFITFNDITNLF